MRQSLAPKNCVTKARANSLDDPTDFLGNLSNHYLATHVRVKEKAQHLMASEAPWKSIHDWYVPKCCTGSFFSSYCWKVSTLNLDWPIRSSLQDLPYSHPSITRSPGDFQLPFVTSRVPAPNWDCPVRSQPQSWP